MRATGARQGTENRPSMFARICVPSPSPKRPPDMRWRSHAAYATTIGLRGKARITELRTCSRVVCSSASNETMSPSWIVSGTRRPSKPMRSTRRA